MEQRFDVSKEEMSNKLPRIIACDFDGTLVEDRFPHIGDKIHTTWERLREEVTKGAKIVLWTCRDGENLASAVQFCESHGLVFDAVNCNIDEVQGLFNNDTRKVYADEYWDDKALSHFCVR